MTSTRMSLSAYAILVAADTYEEAAITAASNGRILGKYGDPTEDAREGLTAAEAISIAMQDPSLIYVVETF